MEDPKNLLVEEHLSDMLEVVPLGQRLYSSAEYCAIYRSSHRHSQVGLHAGLKLLLGPGLERSVQVSDKVVIEGQGYHKSRPLMMTPYSFVPMDDSVECDLVLLLAKLGATGKFGKAFAVWWLASRPWTGIAQP